MVRLLRIIEKVKKIDRALLIIAIICMITASIFTLYFGDNLTLDNEEYSIFIWFSIIGSVWICILSFVLILISAIAYKKEKLQIWDSLKKEIILIVSLIASLTIFHLCTLTVYN